jgi:RNA polymerase sigma-70 factor (ECF subfamily)
VPEDIVLRDPDSRVMLQVRQDKPGAFELLVDRYRHRVVAIAAHMLHDQEEAEDLAQEVFLRVFRNQQPRPERHP